MLNLRQIFCSHDWVTAESMSISDAIVEFVGKQSENPFPYTLNDILYTTPYRSTRILHDKVCIKCKLVKPDLSNFRKKLEETTEEDFNNAKIAARDMFLSEANKAKAWRKDHIKAKTILTEYLNNI